MKRIAVLLIFVGLCISAVGYGLAHNALSRHQARDARSALERPLVLDAATRAIFAGADRVETFRLADFHEGEMGRSSAEDQALAGGRLGRLDDYTVLRAGAPQGKAFAGGLNAALSGLNESPMTSCFDPGVGFRVWQGKAHTDLCVCFYCSGVDIITQDARHKEVFRQRTSLGGSRAAFLALARRAFPQDERLLALKG